jgi:hypothetical protein
MKKSLKIPKGGNQNLYIEEQTTQWPKENVQKDKQRSTKHTYKTKHPVTRTPLKTNVYKNMSHRCHALYMYNPRNKKKICKRDLHYIKKILKKNVKNKLKHHTQKPFNITIIYRKYIDIR